MSPARWQNPSRYQCPSIVMTCTGSTTRVVSSSRDPDRYSISTDRPASVASRTSPKNSGVSTSRPTAARTPSAASSFASARAQRVVVRAGHRQQQAAPTPPPRTPPPASTAAAGRTPPGRNARTDVSDTSISISVSGVYGGVPQHAASSNSATNSCSLIPNRRDTSAIGASPTCASHPITASSRPQPPARLCSWRRTRSRPPRRFCPHRTRRPPPFPPDPDTVRLRLRLRSSRSRSLWSARSTTRRARLGTPAARARWRGRRGRGPTSGSRRTTTRRGRARRCRRRDGRRPCPRRPVGDAAGFERRRRRMRISTGSAALRVPWLVGQRRLDVDGALALGHDRSALPASPLVTSPSMRSTRNVRTAVAARGPTPRGTSGRSGTTARAGRRGGAPAAVGERRGGPRAHGLEEVDERRRGDDATRWAGRRRGRPRPTSAAHPSH